MPKDSHRTEPLQGIVIDPYGGGSHRAFLNALKKHSSHTWSEYTGTPRHWKWRMRSYPLELVQAQRRDGFTGIAAPQGMLVTSMLDLPAYRGFLASSLSDHRITETERKQILWLLQLPTAIYFHENQLTYPVSPHAKTDTHYGYTNVLSGLAASEVWFNSKHHLNDFLAAATNLIRKMPDSQKTHNLAALERKSRVIHPGFQWVGNPVRDRQNTLADPLRIGWVARWEYDKRPDLFQQLLRTLIAENVSFQLILLGQRQPNCEIIEQIEQEFSDQIIYSGHAHGEKEFHQWLRTMDVVVSTADHEFFGIGICEAISAGAVPVLPHRLAYPEIAPESQLYRNQNEAVQLLMRLRDTRERTEASEACMQKVKNFTFQKTIASLDTAFEKMLSG